MQRCWLQPLLLPEILAFPTITASSLALCRPGPPSMSLLFTVRLPQWLCFVFCTGMGSHLLFFKLSTLFLSTLLLFSGTNGLPSACENNILYPATLCRVFPPGFNPQTGPNAVPGKWPNLFRGVRNVNLANEYPTGNERGPLVSRATAAMAVADSMSDRLAIASGGLINITLSAQQLLACADWPQDNIQAPNYGAPNDLSPILQYVHLFN